MEKYDSEMRSAKKFKKLSTSEKYEMILSFCDKYERLPFYKSKNKTEEKMRAFLVNKWNKQKRFETGKSAFGLPSKEIIRLRGFDKYKESTDDKLKMVLAFCVDNERTPHYDAEADVERLAAKKMVSLKHLERAGKLSKEEIKVMVKINSFTKESRDEKLIRLLQFCKDKKRTPKQHVKNVNEKKLGEFLSTVKRVPTENLSEKEKTNLDEILKYAPKARQYTRKQLLNNLLKYVTDNNKIPKNRKYSTDNEKEIGKFYIKFRWLYNNDMLNDEEKGLFTKINKLCE